MSEDLLQKLTALMSQQAPVKSGKKSKKVIFETTEPTEPTTETQITEPQYSARKSPMPVKPKKGRPKKEQAEQSVETQILNLVVENLKSKAVPPPKPKQKRLVTPARKAQLVEQLKKAVEAKNKKKAERMALLEQPVQPTQPTPERGNSLPTLQPAPERGNSLPTLQPAKPTPERGNSLPTLQPAPEVVKQNFVYMTKATKKKNFN